MQLLLPFSICILISDPLYRKGQTILIIKKIIFISYVLIFSFLVVIHTNAKTLEYNLSPKSLKGGIISGPRNLFANNHRLVNWNIATESFFKSSDPQEFVTKLYSLILLGSDTNNKERFAELFFSPDLLKQYMRVVKIDKRSNEVGYLNDFDNFTGWQEEALGFWVGKTITHASTIYVPVYLNLNGNVFNQSKPDVVLHLIKIGNRFRIDDIEYKSSGSSLRKMIKDV